MSKWKKAHMDITAGTVNIILPVLCPNTDHGAFT